MILDLIKGNKLPSPGLCNTLLNTKCFETLELFEPTTEEIYKYKAHFLFWGANHNEIHIEAPRKSREYALTPTRIAILLFIAAMHDEI